MFEEWYLSETIKRFNESQLTVKDDKKLVKDLVKHISESMDLIGIKNYRYIVRFDMISEYGNDPKYLVTLVKR